MFRPSLPLHVVALWFVALAISAPAEEVEVKYLIRQKDTAAALSKITPQLKHEALAEQVCFFDTPKLDLQKAGIILRARQKSGEDDDSTLKLRAKDNSPVTGPLASALPVEQDWISARDVNFSRSLDNKQLKQGLFKKVMEGAKPPQDLFKQQEALLNEQKPGFDWSLLKRFGALHAQVWKKEIEIAGFDKKITVENWLLDKPGSQRAILELSAKVKGDSAEEIKAKAKAFFDAIEAAEFGKSESTSKTRIVLDFFKPGQ